MEKYVEKLNSIKLPQFILVKNIEFEHPEDLDAPLSRGEILQSGSDYDSLKAHIPIPKIPEDEYKLSLYEKKYGDASVIKPEYDDSPMDVSVGDPMDYEIFGSSYTIVWMVPPDEELIVEALINAYAKSRKLIAIYDEFIDRMHVFPFYTLETISDDFYETICSRFEVTAINLKEPTSEKDWDELYEYL